MVAWLPKEGTGGCVVKLSVRFLLLLASEGVTVLVSTEREREYYAITLYLTAVGKDNLTVCTSKYKMQFLTVCVILKCV